MSDLREAIIAELLIAPSSGCTAVSRFAAEKYADRILTMLWDHAMAGVLVLPHRHEPSAIAAATQRAETCNRLGPKAGRA